MPTIRSRLLNRHLKKLREELDERERFHGREGVKQADIALAIGESQSQISKIERELVDLTSWKAARLYELLMAYHVTPGEMLRLAEEHGLMHLVEYLGDRSNMYGGAREGPRVRYMGTAGEGELREGTPLYVTVPDEIARLYRLEDVFAVAIDEHTMLDEATKDELKPPCRVFFHRKLQADPGEVVCAYLPNHDLIILKRWAANQYAVLSDSSGSHAPIVITQDEPLVTEGVYLTHLPLTARLQ